MLNERLVHKARPVGGTVPRMKCQKGEAISSAASLVGLQPEVERESKPDPARACLGLAILLC